MYSCTSITDLRFVALKFAGEMLGQNVGLTKVVSKSSTAHLVNFRHEPRWMIFLQRAIVNPNILLQDFIAILSTNLIFANIFPRIRAILSAKSGGKWNWQRNCQLNRFADLWVLKGCFYLNGHIFKLNLVTDSVTFIPNSVSVKTYYTSYVLRVRPVMTKSPKIWLQVDQTRT
jgi:hypothetical protein